MRFDALLIRWRLSIKEGEVSLGVFKVDLEGMERLDGAHFRVVRDR